MKSGHMEATENLRSACPEGIESQGTPRKVATQAAGKTPPAKKVLETKIGLDMLLKVNGLIKCSG
jgi:hypothetical protein